MPYAISRMQNSLSTKQEGSGNRVPKWLYDPRERTFCGRTAQSWLFICIYYLWFYFLLVCFSSGLLWVYMHTQEKDKEPVRTGEQSVLNLRPGLRSRPPSIVYSKQNNPEYVKELRLFLEKYEKSTLPGGCRDIIHQACKFQLDKNGTDCFNPDYGYNTKEPCFMLTINRIYGWLPKIDKSRSKGGDLLVSCSGKTSGGKEITPNFEYYPGATDPNNKSITYGMFENKYFPFVGQDDYLSPIVAVHLKQPLPSEEFSVNCKFVNVKNAYDRPLEFRVHVRDYKD